MAEKFQKLLADISEDYLGERYLWLRLLLHDHVPIECLDKSTTGLELFNELGDSDYISTNDVALLWDVAEVTSQKAVKRRISEYKTSVQCSDTDGTRLTAYRKALFKTLRNVGAKDLTQVIGYYNIRALGLNKWDTVFYLEKEGRLDNSQEKCTIFANLINQMAKNMLLASLSADDDQTTPLNQATRCVPVNSSNEVSTPMPQQPPVAATSTGVAAHSTPGTSEAQKMSENDFQLLKTIVSKYYDSHGCLVMLKVLFADHVRNKAKLSTITSTMDLLNELVASGDVSHDDITMLYNTIKLTGHFGLQNDIRKQFKTFPNVRQIQITEFTEYRQKIMQFGMGMSEEERKTINGYYNNPVKDYTNDNWNMIYDFECRKIIKERKIQEFVDILKKLNLTCAAELE
ncbi:uncharacterized protein [Antedon mediterranea]|uniref:uncharacterized protein n=1 Tax=Antedon mediterranea TaxID=105859 RepID=UPI003AF64F34